MKGDRLFVVDCGEDLDRQTLDPVYGSAFIMPLGGLRLAHRAEIIEEPRRICDHHIKATVRTQIYELLYDAGHTEPLSLISTLLCSTSHRCTQ